MSCVDETSQQPIETYGNEGYQGLITMFVTDINEVVIMVTDNSDPDIIPLLYVLQMERETQVDLLTTTFDGIIFEDENQLTITDIDTKSKYILSIEPNNDGITIPNYFYGYGLSKNEGVFERKDIVCKEKSIFNSLLKYCDAPAGLKYRDKVLLEPLPCSTSSCSYSFQLMGNSFSCSVSCLSGYTAICGGSGCYCQKCDDGGSTPANQGGGSIN